MGIHPFVVGYRGTVEVADQSVTDAVIGHSFYIVCNRLPSKFKESTSSCLKKQQIRGGSNRQIST